MKAFAVLLASLMTSSVSMADEIQIVDVRRNIPMSDEEPVYKDFYINAGNGSSLKKNLVVTAVRKWTVRDSVGAQSFGDVEVPVGQLKIIAVYGKVAIAREHKLLSRDDNPMLEQVGLMVGDRIEVKGSFVDNSVPKRETAAVQNGPPNISQISTEAPAATAILVVPNVLTDGTAPAAEVAPAVVPGPTTASAEANKPAL